MVDFVFICRHKFAGHLHKLCFVLAPVFSMSPAAVEQAPLSALLTLF
jgi:hypothetical protein